MAPAKRWMTVAEPEGAGWCLSAPVPVGDAATLPARLLGRAAGRPAVLGIDCPLGLPRDYAARHAGGAVDFPAFLRALADRPGFFTVSATLETVGPAAPFYPARGIAGMTRAAHAAALGLPGAAALNRACDRATATRPAGAPVFWTLGANQSGKAAIAAWRDMLLPAFAAGAPLDMWPFAGRLAALLAPGRLALAETYPAEAMRQLGLPIRGSKRRQADRAAYAGPLRAAAASLGAVPDPALEAALAHGFGPAADGEDRFDSVIGCLGVLTVLRGRRPDTAPDDPWIARWEGWVLGQTDLPRAG